METVGNSFYPLVNEEKGVIPCGQSRVMGFYMLVMRLLDSCRTGATNTNFTRRWTVFMADLWYVILYHKECISKRKTHPAPATHSALHSRLKC